MNTSISRIFLYLFFPFKPFFKVGFYKKKKYLLSPICPPFSSMESPHPAAWFKAGCHTIPSHTIPGSTGGTCGPCHFSAWFLHSLRGPHAIPERGFRNLPESGFQWPAGIAAFFCFCPLCDATVFYLRVVFYAWGQKLHERKINSFISVLRFDSIIQETLYHPSGP